MAKKTKSLFLYEPPFLVEDTLSNRQAFLSDTVRYSDYEREDERKIHEILFKFAIDMEILEIRGEKVFHSRKENTGSWVWFANWGNFRSLVDIRQYTGLVGALTANGLSAADALYEIHMALGTLFDARLLNTIVHRTISAISALPYPTEEDAVVQEWTQIHEEAPFLWILILIRSVSMLEIAKQA